MRPSTACLVFATTVVLSWTPVSRADEDASVERPTGPSANQTASAAITDTRTLIEQGQRLEHAEGTRRDFARAQDFYCEAARAASPDGFVRLGWMYANGRGVARDDSIANTLFRRAAALGSEIGARLASAVRGSEDVLPPCLTQQPPAVAVADPAPAPPAASAIEVAPTPVVESPAQWRPAPTSVEHKRFVASVLQQAREFRLDPRLVFALMRVESNFDPLARSQKNAQGLMQLIPETAERFAVKDVWDPIENLRGGMGYLRWLLAYFKGDVVLTLAAYNAGEGAVDRHRGVPPYPETLAYVQRIRTFYPLDWHPFDSKLAASIAAAFVAPVVPPTSQRAFGPARPGAAVSRPGVSLGAEPNGRKPG